MDKVIPNSLELALRQYQHNECSGLLFGFDHDETINVVNSLHEEIERLREALVYVAHASHKTPIHQLPLGVMLSDGDGVEVKLNAGVTVVAKHRIKQVI